MCAAQATAASSRSLPASPGHPHGQRTQTRPAGPIAAALGRAEPPGGRRGGGISSSGRPQQGGAERAPAHSSPNAASAPPYCPAGGGAAPAGRRPLVACGELPGRPAGRGVALTGWSHSLYRGCVRWLRQPRPEGAVLEACPAVQRGARLASCKERSFKCSMV